jgi:predicted RNase H-like HicB family nuclease
MHYYSFHVFWSDEDESYIATVPGFKYVSAHGETPDEALREIQIALRLVIESYKAEGWELLEPQVLAATA